MGFQQRIFFIKGDQSAKLSHDKSRDRERKKKKKNSGDPWGKLKKEENGKYVHSKANEIFISPNWEFRGFGRGGGREGLP